MERALVHGALRCATPLFFSPQLLETPHMPEGGVQVERGWSTPSVTFFSRERADILILKRSRTRWQHLGEGVGQ